MSVELKYIKGRELIDFLNSNSEELEDIQDETMYYKFEYEKQFINDDHLILEFTIDNDYVARGNRIYIDNEGNVDTRIEEPFDSGSQYEEIEEMVKLYLKNLEIDIRDNKISEVIDTENDLKEKYKNRILSKLEDLTSKIKSSEEMPHGEQDSKLLSDIEDRLEEVLNNWYY